MKMRTPVMMVTLAAMLTACYQSTPQMTNMCGVNPQTMQQSCVMVPANQAAQYYNNGYYNYNNGVYRDRGGHEVAAATLGAAAGAVGGYMLGQHMANRNNQSAAQAPYYAGAAPARMRGPDGRFISATQATQQPYVPTSAAVTPTSKAPTSGLMAGRNELQLTPATHIAPPAPNFAPRSAIAPVPNASTFTPRSAMTSTVPAAAKSTFQPSSVSRQSKPSSSGFTPKSAKPSKK